MPPFASRGGEKLEHALSVFGIDVAGLDCADLGCSTGGFTDCLLRRGAGRVFCVDTGYGVLDWKLRKDPRVVVMERTNAMHVSLPVPVSLVVIDVGWTRQKHILPAARRLLIREGRIVSLVKPHYEADAAMLRGGILPDDRLTEVLDRVNRDIAESGLCVAAQTPSPIRGQKGNAEVLYLLQLMHDDPRRAATIVPQS